MFNLDWFNKSVACHAGLTMNGFRILDLASEGDDRVTIDGDVELEVKQLRQTT